MSDLREEILAALDAGFASTLKVYGRDFVEATWPHVLQEKEEKVDRIIALIRQAQADGRLPADAGRAGGAIATETRQGLGPDGRSSLTQGDEA